MKRTELIREINRIAKAQGKTASYAEGGKHTVVRLGSRQTTIPRHTEINEFTAKAILAHIRGER